MSYRRMCEILPPGRLGSAEVDHFEIEQTWAQFRPREKIRPGKYARLRINGVTMMSDTQMEQRTCMGAIWHATGDVLVVGLGIGMILPPILEKPEVRTVTVFEKNPDVIGLVEPPLRGALGALGEKLKVIEADAFTVRSQEAGGPFDFIWLDIWPDSTAGNLPEIRILRRRFSGPRWRRKGCEVLAWCEPEARDEARQEARDARGMFGPWRC